METVSVIVKFVVAVAVLEVIVSVLQVLRGSVLLPGLRGVGGSRVGRL
jgi:ethanolamine transporter EutH